MPDCHPWIYRRAVFCGLLLFPVAALLAAGDYAIPYTFTTILGATRSEEGVLKYTGKATDLGIAGDGFFIVQASTGNDRFATRDGRFQIDDRGFLVTAGGLRVQGLVGPDLSRVDAIPVGLPIQFGLSIQVGLFIPTGTQLQSVVFDMSGNLIEYYSDGRSAITNRVQLQSFSTPSDLVPLGENLFTALHRAGPVGGEILTGNNDPGFHGLGTIQSGTTFSGYDSAGQSLREFNPSCIPLGLGLSLGGYTSNSPQGTFTTTGIVTDLGISGRGYFLVRDPVDGQISATRNGHFRIDETGFLVASHGLRVLGRQIDSTLREVVDFQVSRSLPAGATLSSISFDTTGNLIEFYSDGTSAPTLRIQLQEFEDTAALLELSEGIYTGLTAAGPVGGALLAGNNDPGFHGLGSIQSGTLEIIPGDSGRVWASGTTAPSGKNNPLELNLPYGGVATDQAGILYIADRNNFTIRKLTPEGAATIVAGSTGLMGTNDGTGEAARFNHPEGIVVDQAGNLYVADTGNNIIRKITASGVVSTFAGCPGEAGSLDGLGSAARFTRPSGLALDHAGNLFIADRGNNLIRKISPEGSVTTFAGTAGSRGSTDGIGPDARFDHPSGVAVDANDNVYVADTWNSTIRKITPAGVVSTFAGAPGEDFNFFYDGSGENSAYQDGTGHAARFCYPYGVAVDSGDNVYVTDTSNFTVRKITPNRTVTTLAGFSRPGFGNEGTGRSVRFTLPTGLTVDPTGALYVVDYDKIRKGRAASDSAMIPSGFDPAAYLARYPDLAVSLGNDDYGAWIYYRDHGIYEGEVFDDEFRVEEYLALYPELFAHFGNNLGVALEHWLTAGKLEGRLGRVPADFSAQGYFDRNPDVALAVNRDPAIAWTHYWAFGIFEGRAYDEEFRVFEYLALNADLQAAFLTDWRGATLHWMRYGRTEGRLGRIPLIFNSADYLNRNLDVAAAWGTFPTTVFLHFWLYGIDEGRTFDEEFRANEYLALNPDLATAFGTDRRAAFKHWVRYGRAEGRTARFP